MTGNLETTLESRIDNPPAIFSLKMHSFQQTSPTLINLWTKMRNEPNENIGLSRLNWYLNKHNKKLFTLIYNSLHSSTVLLPNFLIIIKALHHFCSLPPSSTTMLFYSPLQRHLLLLLFSYFLTQPSFPRLLLNLTRLESKKPLWNILFFREMWATKAFSCNTLISSNQINCLTTKQWKHERTNEETKFKKKKD